MSRYMSLMGQNAREASLDKIDSKTKNLLNGIIQEFNRSK